MDEKSDAEIAELKQKIADVAAELRAAGVSEREIENIYLDDKPKRVMFSRSARMARRRR
jgi:hypothetical protein